MKRLVSKCWVAIWSITHGLENGDTTVHGRRSSQTLSIQCNTGLGDSIHVLGACPVCPPHLFGTRIRIAFSNRQPLRRFSPSGAVGIIQHALGFALCQSHVRCIHRPHNPDLACEVVRYRAQILPSFELRRRSAHVYTTPNDASHTSKL